MRVLLIEDDAMIGKGWSRRLNPRACRSIGCATASRPKSRCATAAMRSRCSISDCRGADGLEVLKRARAKGVETPVLVITARDGVDDRVAGLDLGADDYLVKPFELRELQARMRALIRRRAGRATSLLIAGARRTQHRDA